MRKTLTAAGITLLLGGSAVAIVSATVEATPQHTRLSSTEAISRAEAALRAHRTMLHAAPGESYEIRGVITDAGGASHVRYDRTYRGLPVLGGDFVVHNAPSGAFAGASVAQQTAVAVDTTPEITAEVAEAAARKVHQGTVAEVRPPRLVVDATEATPRLVWETVVLGMQEDGQTPSRLHVLTDARTGDVVRHWDDIRHAVPGTGTGIYVGTVRIDTTAIANGFEMKDPERGGNLTCDMHNRPGGACTTFTDVDNVWELLLRPGRAAAGVDAHYGAATTYDYFKKVHGRSGIFGDGRGVPSRVHYGDNYVNAFWDGQQMTYGDGENNARPLVSLDVAGHEMAHGVTENTANLTYSGEPGGLNEATSDIFGTAVEYYAENPNDPGDYLIGEKIDIYGDGKPLRYMHQPSVDGKSPDCYYDGIGGLDVHYSSGIGNKFFYMLSEGSHAESGQSPTCGAPAVTGIGRDKAARIWFRALVTYFVSTTNYRAARAGTLSAAKDLYEECGPEYQAVQAAWNAAAVPGKDPSCGGTSTPTATASASPSTSNAPSPTPSNPFPSPSDSSFPAPPSDPPPSPSGSPSGTPTGSPGPGPTGTPPAGEPPGQPAPPAPGGGGGAGTGPVPRKE